MQYFLLIALLLIMINENMDQPLINGPLPTPQPSLQGAYPQQFLIPSVLALNKSQAINYQKKKAFKVMTLLSDL